MDFNTLKKFNLEKLKRNDLGSNYQDIFNGIYLISSRLKDLLLSFETTYPHFLEIDRNKFEIIINNFGNFLNLTTSFSVSTGETVASGLEKARSLLAEINEFYAHSLVKISELQTYFRDDSKRNLEQQIGSLQTDFKNLSTSVQNTLNEKINEINNIIKVKQTDSDEFLRSGQVTLSSKINEIDQRINSKELSNEKFLIESKNTFEEKVNELISEIRTAKETVKEVEEIKTNIEKLNETTQNFSVGNLVTAYGTIFETQAKKNLKASRWFGAFFLISVFIAIGIVIKWFIPLLREFNDLENLKAIEYYILSFVVRITVLSFVYWIVKELLRNYNSNSHLYHLNMHRYNSLRSFEIIVRNNVLPENRDSIVKEIAQTIFAHQEDGFLSKDKKDLPLMDIVNLINAVKK